MGSELGITIQERLHGIVLGNFMTVPSHCPIKNRIIHNTRKEKRPRKFHCARELSVVFSELVQLWSHSL